MWESRLSGSERGRVSTCIMGEILWHRRETRRQTEKTNITLPRWECLSYSNPCSFCCSLYSERPKFGAGPAALPDAVEHFVELSFSGGMIGTPFALVTFCSQTE